MTTPDIPGNEPGTDAGHIVVLAGGTGDLGHRIALALVARGATLRALVRPGTSQDRVAQLAATGAAIRKADYADAQELRAACTDATCIVSALNGLSSTMLGSQGQLLDAAVAAGVPRFIPSDFAMDYVPLPE